MSGPTSDSRLSSKTVVPSLQARFGGIHTRPSGSASTRSFASGGRAMYQQSCRAAPPTRLLFNKSKATPVLTVLFSSRLEYRLRKIPLS